MPVLRSLHVFNLLRFGQKDGLTLFVLGSRQSQKRDQQMMIQALPSCFGSPPAFDHVYH